MSEVVDVSPALLERVQDLFQRRLKSDPTLDALKGNPRFQSKYAQRLGEHLAKALCAVLDADSLPDGKLYWNIAKAVVEPMLMEDYRLVNESAAVAQQVLDERAGIKLKTRKSRANKERMKGILDDICVDGLDLAEAHRRLTVDTINISQSFWNDFVEENAGLRFGAGLTTMVTRRITDPKDACKWCKRLAGTWRYDERPEDFFRQHTNCTCEIEYMSEKTYAKLDHGYTKKRVNLTEKNRDLRRR